MKLNTGVRNSLISSAAAAVIYIVIALATGGDVGPTIAIGLAIGVVVFLVQQVIGAVVRSSKKP